MQLIDGLATVRGLLAEGRQDEGRALLKKLAAAAPADQPWLQLIDLESPTLDEVAYLEWFVRQEVGAEGAHPPPVPPAAPRLTEIEFADGLAQVRAMLSQGQEEQARELLRKLYVSAAASQAPWLQFLVLDPPIPDELAYLEEFLRKHVHFNIGAEPSARLDILPSRTSEMASTFMTARAMLGAGRRNEGKALLRQLTRSSPSYEAPWLQLLALEPSPPEEIALIEEFLQHHPGHRFAQACQARLETVRMVAMLGGAGEQPLPDPHAPKERPRQPMRLGDYLTRQHWVTAEQIEHALAQQRALRAEGVEQPIGTLLLMYGHVRIDQLAVAFAEAAGTGFGGFGDYLVRTGVLSAQQVGEAMARQAGLAIEHEREYSAAMAAYQAQMRAIKRTGRLLLGRSLPAEPKRKPAASLGDVLVAMGLLTTQQVAAALAERQRMFESLFH